MKPEQDPVVIDLASRRKAARKAEQVKPRQRPLPSGREPLLGSRPHAPLILALLLGAALAMWLAPKLI